ncbi:helix-turn-helix transcriptional regulator [Priestia aryabhattai]|uniref:Helix-turn-helix transcriptional regulator n=1 Tax=Priestia aryabhattai TaxID=412384 RepID=A0ABD7X4R8_PRIAR|nr:helix-turn-helix transcriptional regulator [Priestia aryabhattai]WEA47312.1 helix-turn-helix transcriptional regulator [Priestia aryabhattai]
MMNKTKKLYSYKRNEKLIQARKGRELTQKQTAAIFGTSRQYICQIERGERRPGPEFAEKLAKFFAMSVQDLR